MPGEIEALHDLAAIAGSGTPLTDALDSAARILRRAAGAEEVLLVYAESDEFLVSRDGQQPTANDISTDVLLEVQRQLVTANGPIAFGLNGSKIQDSRRATGDGLAEYLAFHVPTTEGSSEMCLLRGPWPPQGGRSVLCLVESAMPALTLLIERSLDADRSRRHKRQLEAMANAAQVLTRAEDMSTALTDLASSIAKATGFVYVSMDVYDADTERFVLRVMNHNRWSSSPLVQYALDAFNPDRPDRITLAVLNSHEPNLMPDIRQAGDLSESARAFFTQALLTSRAIFPMMFQDEPMGTIAFLSYQPRAFSTDEVDELWSVANQMATALKAVRMYSELARSREQIQRHARRVERQQVKLRQLTAQLREMAATDALTGASNYGRLHEILDRQIARAQKAGTRFSVILGDVNDFKLYNDTYGHLAGDEALRTIVAALRAACRRSDLVARYGGDEFVIILPDTGRRGAEKAARRIATELAKRSFRPEAAKEAVPVELALGIAVFPDDGTTKDALIGHADACMYDSKSLVGRMLGLGDEDDDDDDVKYPISAFGLLDSLVRAIDRRDHYTRTHSENDAEYAALLGEAMGLSGEALRALRIAGLLHDVGKIGIPDRILRKPGLLSDSEREVMQQHVSITERLIADVPHLEDVMAAASNHHERFDGTGYPRGLKGEEIPLLGRLLSVADAFSAMTEDRPYRKAMSVEAAVQELRDCAGTQFDPAVVEVFISDVLPQLEQRKAKAA